MLGEVGAVEERGQKEKRSFQKQEVRRGEEKKGVDLRYQASDK